MRPSATAHRRAVPPVLVAAGFVGALSLAAALSGCGAGG
jgi:hypothetical protein